VRYLDYAATTPLLEEVLEVMLPYQRGLFGNPSSVYQLGRESKKGMEEAREQVAAAIGSQPSEIVFTGGGTEADNMAVKGVAMKARPPSSTTRSCTPPSGSNGRGSASRSCR
jgi:cysteine desulfurase